ncbi:hypothetical protein V2J09_023423 [Rumex salicifolius]
MTADFQTSARTATTSGAMEIVGSPSSPSGYWMVIFPQRNSSERTGREAPLLPATISFQVTALSGGLSGGLVLAGDSVAIGLIELGVSGTNSGDWEFWLQKLRDLVGVRSKSYEEERHQRFCTKAANEACKEEDNTINVTFVDKDGEEQKIKVPIGMSILEAAHEFDVELEGNEINCIPRCTQGPVKDHWRALHDVDYYNKLDDPTDEENDMLDLAFGLTETSRLGCQVIAAPELDGIRLALPSATRNFAVDGYKPKPH